MKKNLETDELKSKGKKILDEEQSSIINSTEKYIYVSACPRLWKNLHSCKKNRKIITRNKRLSRYYCLFFYKRSF